MRISFKLIIYLWIGLFAIISVLLYNAYSRLKPETFVALISEQLQKNYPGSKLDVGIVDYHYSLDFNLNLKNVHLRRGLKVLGSIGEIELIVPWWLLLTSKGNAQVNLSDLIIYVDSDQKIDSSITVSEKSKRANHQIKVVLPEYLAHAKFTLRAKNVSVRDSKNQKSYFKLSKLLVREFQYGKNSAFELNVPVEITHKKIQYTSELWLFGDLTPDPEEWKLNYRGDLKTREVSDRFQVDDLVIHGNTTFKPSQLDVKSQVNLLIDKEDIGSGEFSANENKMSVLLNFTKVPLSFFHLLNEEIKNRYLTSLDGEGEGQLKFEKYFNTDTATAHGRLAFPGLFQLTQKDTIPGNWQIKFQDANWEISFLSPKKEASFLRKSHVDFKSRLITQYADEISFKGLDFDLVVSVLPSLAQTMTLATSPQFTTDIKFQECLQADRIISGTFNSGMVDSKVFYKLELSEKNNFFKMNYLKKNNLSSLNLDFNNFTLTSTFNILEPYFSANGVRMNGRLDGRWPATWSDGEWLVQLRASDLAEPSGSFIDLTQKFWGRFEIDSRNFPIQNWDTTLKNNTLRINSLTVEGKDLLKITGTVQKEQKQRSTLTLLPLKSINPVPVTRNDVPALWLEKEQ